jgi:hypothetical protein
MSALASPPRSCAAKSAAPSGPCLRNSSAVAELLSLATRATGLARQHGSHQRHTRRRGWMSPTRMDGTTSWREKNSAVPCSGCNSGLPLSRAAAGFLDAPPGEPDHVRARQLHSRSDMRGPLWTRPTLSARDELGRSGGHISRLSDQSDRSPPRKLSAAHPTDDNDHHGLPAINTKIKLLLLLCGRRVRRPSVKPLAPLSSELPGIARLGN